MRIDVESELSRLRPGDHSDALSHDTLSAASAARRRETRTRLTVLTVAVALVLGLGAWSWARTTPPTAQSSASASPAPSFLPGRYHEAALIPRREVLKRCNVTDAELISAEQAFPGGMIIELTRGRACLIGWDHAPADEPVTSFDPDLVRQCSETTGYDFTGWDAFTDGRTDDGRRVTVLVSQDQWFAVCELSLGDRFAPLTFESLQQTRRFGEVKLWPTLGAMQDGATERLLQLDFSGADPVWAPDGRLSDAAASIEVADEHGHQFSAPVVRGFAFLRAHFSYESKPALPVQVPPLTATVRDANGATLFVYTSA